MAPKNIPGLNIGDTNQLLSAMGFQRPKTAAEIMQLYNQGLAGQGPLKDKFIPPIGQLQTKPGETRGMGILKGLGNIGLAGLENLRKGTGFISAFTDPSGNIIGDILSQESPEGFRKRVEARDRSKDTIGGQEPFLPNVQLNVPGSDIFTDAGQEAMRGSAAKAIQDTLGKNIGDPSAFGAGDFADSETIKKVQEEIDKKNIDTSAPDSDIDYTETFTDKDLETATEVGVQGADTAAKKATVKALDEFLKDARPGVSPKTFDEYINEFGEATGLDISGEADTKQALMSFGLALMQNRAGKGFNISNILRATGEAGEAAMPDFRKAVAEAKAIRAKAGAYALSKKESDQKKAMDRKSYVVMPKEGGLANSILQNTGRFARLNSYELNNLMNNEEFNKQFEIIDSSVYTDMTKSLITAQGKNKTYIESPKSVPLYDGSDFKIDVFYANPNTGGDAKNKLATDPKIAFAELERMEKGLQRGEEKFGQIAQLLAQTDITIPNQLQSTVTQIARNFGIKAPDSTTTPIKQLQNLLKEIGARNAAAILGETGKTLSDNDRKLVDDIIGKIDFASGDKDELVRKLNRLYTQIQSAKRDQINQGYATLRSFGHEVVKNKKSNSGFTVKKIS
tara:strand:- start:716 stop:2584 length:1869 start_codon:yes stop_codon:yes gene_type:complete